MAAILNSQLYKKAEVFNAVQDIMILPGMNISAESFVATY